MVRRAAPTAELLGTGGPRRGARNIVRLARDPAFAEMTGGNFSVKMRGRSLLPCMSSSAIGHSWC